MRATDASPALTTAVRVAVVLAALFVALHLLVARPTAFPAGAGFTLRAGAIAGPLADPSSLRLTRPPDPSRPIDPESTVTPGGPAEIAGLRPADLVASARSSTSGWHSPGDGSAGARRCPRHCATPCCRHWPRSRAIGIGRRRRSPRLQAGTR